MTAASERTTAEGRTVGVLGGMGPAATLDFLHAVQAATPAGRDQDHVRTLVDVRPGVPDRTAHLLGRGPSPLPVLREMARGLVAAGADFLVMPCNTAHAWHEPLAASVDVPFLDMVRIATEATVRSVPDGASVALLATRGTRVAGTYPRAFEAFDGVELVLPDEEEQARVQEAIDQVKAGRTPEAVRTLEPVVSALEARGVERFLLACTELPIAVKAGLPDLAIVDATTCLAEATVRHALEGRR